MTRIPPAGLRLLLVVTMMLTGALLVGFADPASANQPAGDRCLSANEALLLDRINTFRMVSGLAPLVASPTLTAAARHHAESMATYNYFPADYSVRHEGENHDQTITWQGTSPTLGIPTTRTPLAARSSAPAPTPQRRSTAR